MAKSMGKSSFGKGSDYYDDTYIICQPCSAQGKGDLPANSFCVDCQEYICNSCSSYHKVIKVLQNHVLVTIEEAKKKTPSMVTKDKSSLKCTLHHDKTVKYFCVSHAYLGCSVCITMNHKQCTDVDYIPTVAKDIRNHDGFKKFDEKLKALETAYKTGISDVKKNLKKIKADERQMKEAVKRVRKQLNDALDKYEKELTVKAGTICREGTTKLNVLSKELAKSLADVDSLVDKCNTLLSSGKNCDTYVLMKKEADQLVSLEKELIKAVQSASCQRYEFQPNEDMRNADTVGKLSFRSETVAFSSAVIALVPLVKDGPSMVKLLKKGTRVRRGKDWKWDDQDGGGLGTIISPYSCCRIGWFEVEWDGGTSNRIYRMGAEGAYDLEIV